MLDFVAIKEILLVVFHQHFAKFFSPHSKKQRLAKLALFKMKGKLMPRSTSWAAIFVRLMVGGLYLIKALQPSFVNPLETEAQVLTSMGLPFVENLLTHLAVIRLTCSACLILGIGTRFLAFLLLIDVASVVITQQIPYLMQCGLWPMDAELQVNGCLLLGCLYLSIAGAGRCSIDQLFAKI